MTSRIIDVAVIGAGFAGIAMAIALRNAGRSDVVVFERGSSVGGTWRDNTYPGIACDVPSHLYGFASHPNPNWSAVFAPGAEIERYLADVVAQETLAAQIRLCSPLTSALWDAGLGAWRLEIDGALHLARSLVLACGRLTEPAIPEIPGLSTFAGRIFHTARWDHSVPLDGGWIAVVGTGASAVQVVPELVRRGAQVTLFQRTPAWILPRGGREYSPAERTRFAGHPEVLAALRADLYADGEARHASRAGDGIASAAAVRAAQSHLAAQVADPALRHALTPTYAFGCKRVLLSDDFYPAVASPAVHLESSALAEVRDGVLVAASGTRRHADTLVLATGFSSTSQPYAQLVRGEDDESLAAHWSRGMVSFGSTVVAGFPNLFVLNGPNASLGHNSAVLMMEEQAAYVVRALGERDRRCGGVLRVRPEAETAYTAEIDAAAAGTAWVDGGCQNWYVDERSGRLALLWPGTAQAFRERLAAADGSEFLPEAALTERSRSQRPS